MIVRTGIRPMMILIEKEVTFYKDYIHYKIIINILNY